MEFSKQQCRDMIARRAAREFHDGELITLGIGLPTEVADYLPADLNVIVQSENGMIGVGCRDFSEPLYPKVTNAGCLPVMAKSGAVFFDTAMSFTIIRGGHVDATVLGALEVDQEGNLANWMIPGQIIPGMGGAMDLVVGAKRVIVAMEHVARNGQPRIRRKCTLPLTAAHEVDLIITERAIIEVGSKGLVLKELNSLFSLEDVLDATEAELTVSPNLTTASW
jgi:acetate CoA/acetoacetate CoA-transferase beta subunit